MLILILVRLAKFSKVYGTSLLIYHAKCLNERVWSANSHILLFSVVTTYHRAADKQAY